MADEGKAAAGAPAAGAMRPSSSGSASLTSAARPNSAGSSSSGGGIRSKLSLKRKRTNSTSKPSSASDPQQSETAAASSSMSLRKQKGSTRRKKQVISGVFAARRQAREQQRAAAAAAAVSSSALTFPDDLSFKFGGNDDETKQKSSGSGTSSSVAAQNPNRNANSDEDTDPCSSGTDENEFEWSQSRRQSQKQQTDFGGGLEDSQDSMASAGSLQSAASDGTGASNGSGSSGVSSSKKKKTSAERRKRNASSANSGHVKPPIPSFSPVEWSSSHGNDISDGMNVEQKGGKSGSTKNVTEKEEKDTIKAKPKPKSKPKATKSVKRVGVGLDNSSSSSDEEKDDGAAALRAAKDHMMLKDDNKMKKTSANMKRSPDINTNDRAALAAARGDEALAAVEMALAKTASKSEASAADSTVTTAAESAATSSGDDDAKISGATIVPDSAKITRPTAGVPKSGSKGTTATRGWNCSACTLFNTSRKHKCEACGTGRPPSDSPSEKPADDVASSNIDAATANASDPGRSKNLGAKWKCSKCTLDNDARKLTCDACGKQKPLEAPPEASAKSPVIDLSLDDGGKNNGDGQQKQSLKKAESTTNRKKSVKDKLAASAKKQKSGEDSDAKKTETDMSKKAKTSKTSKKTEGTTKATAGTTKAKAAQKKRKRQQPKKKMEVESSPMDDDNFDVPPSKAISDKEKSRDRQHSDYLRQMAKEPSPGKDSDGDYASASKRTKRGGAACALCSTCSCSRGAALKGLEEGAKLDATNPISKFARSDAEIERALLGRLGRLEKSASWFDTLCYKVSRELKKHRHKVAKKRESFGGVGEEEAKPRFLADADVDGQDKGVFYPRAKKSRVEKAHEGLFGTESTVKEAQPTLTQMMRGEDEDDASDNNDDTGREQVPEEVSKGMELDPLADEEVVAVQNDYSVLDADVDDDIYAIENGAAAPNESIIYEETVEGSPVEVRSPMADYHEASQRGLERASRNFQAGMWNAASSAKLFNGDTELPETPEKEANSHSNAEVAEDDLKQKVDAAINDDSETGIDDLLELFQEDLPASAPNTPSPEKSLPSPELQSQLTQRGHDAVEELQDAILADPERLEAIEAVCPSWQDSIRYPFLHTRPDNLEDALAKVRDSRRKLQASRERILAAIKQREEAHNMFEAALLQSMNRFPSGDNSTPHSRSPDSCNEEKKSE